MTVRNVVTWCLVLVLAGLALGISLQADGRDLANPSAVPTRPETERRGCAPDASGTKAPLQGIVTINAFPPGELDDFVGGRSVNVPWSVLQPTEGGPLVQPNPIDDALAAVRAVGPAGSCARGVKVRVLAGTSAPAWAKHLGGAPVPMTLTLDGLSGEVPRFWTPEFGAAYADLQVLLADAYDDVPEIREVVISRCMTFYAEPLLRQPMDGRNAENLAAAGLDEQQDRACLTEQVDAHLVWRSTPSSLALNPYADLRGTREPGGLDVPFAVADHCRDVLGSRCILANNSVRWPALTRQYADLYLAMEHLGAPLEFQIAAPRRVGNVVEAVRWAVLRGADNVEVEPSVVADARTGLAALAALGWGPH